MVDEETLLVSTASLCRREVNILFSHSAFRQSFAGSFPSHPRFATIQYKQQRLNLTAARKPSNAVNEVHEGATYSSSCALADMLMDDKGISDAIVKLEPVQLGIGHQIVLFDLETTDLSGDAQSEQIAACLLSDSSKPFAKYVLLMIAISESAPAVIGIATQLASGNKVLRHNGEKVEVYLTEEIASCSVYQVTVQAKNLSNFRVEANYCILFCFSVRCLS